MHKNGAKSFKYTTISKIKKEIKELGYSSYANENTANGTELIVSSNTIPIMTKVALAYNVLLKHYLETSNEGLQALVGKAQKMLEFGHEAFRKVIMMEDTVKGCASFFNRGAQQNNIDQLFERHSSQCRKLLNGMQYLQNCHTVVPTVVDEMHDVSAPIYNA